jgi:hypothetical protein
VLACLGEILDKFMQGDPEEPEKAPVVTLVRTRPDLSA